MRKHAPWPPGAAVRKRERCRTSSPCRGRSALAGSVSGCGAGGPQRPDASRPRSARPSYCAWTSWRPAALWPGGGRRDEWRPVISTRPAAGLPRVAPRPLQCVCAVSSPRADRRAPDDVLAALPVSKRMARPSKRRRHWRRPHHIRCARDVGHDSDGRRGGGLRLRGRRSLRDRMSGSMPKRGTTADPPGHPRTLRGHRRRGPWAAAASRPRVELLGRRFSTGGRVLRHRKFPDFVREPEGNGVAERFIRTLKENLLWVRSFETIEELRLALLEFKRTYNEQWMLEKYDYRSPAQVRRDLLGLDAAA